MITKGAAPMQGQFDRLRDFIQVGNELRRYMPVRKRPALLACHYHSKIRLVYTAYSDAQYFAKYPEARYRFTVRIDNEAMDWTFVTRQSGTIRGDRYDLLCLLQHDKHGTAEARLKRALLYYATVGTHRVGRDAPDLITALR